MFILKIATTRPNTENDFFPNTALGQTYDMLMELTKAVCPKLGPNGLIDFVRTESPDGLMLTSEYKFRSPGGRETLMTDFSIRAASEGLEPIADARNNYNATVGHTSVVTFEKVETE